MVFRLFSYIIIQYLIIAQGEAQVKQKISATFIFLLFFHQEKMRKRELRLANARNRNFDETTTDRSAFADIP